MKGVLCLENFKINTVISVCGNCKESNKTESHLPREQPRFSAILYQLLYMYRCHQASWEMCAQLLVTSLNLSF